MRLVPIILAAATLAAPAFAADRCDVPQDQWRPVEELTAELTAKGWSVSNVKKEDGCYEVYGKDETGKRVEIFFDPASFEQKGSDD